MSERDEEVDFQADQIMFEQHLQKVKVKSIPLTKNCHNCHEPLPMIGRFCDRYCAEDYEKIQRARKNRHA